MNKRATPGFDDEYFLNFMVEYLKKFKTATRADFNRLLRDKLSAALSESQKDNKIKNLIQNLRNNQIIIKQGDNKGTIWMLALNKDKLK